MYQPRYVVAIYLLAALFPLSTTQACISDESVDFIVVGTGSTGSVVINRLSEIDDVTVLALEAGGEPLHISEIPLIAFKALGSEMDWNYKTVPQKTCCQYFINQQVPIFRGKALGGTSSLNFMTYTRGNRRDFDTWKELGNEGWGYEDLFPYFMKLEDYRVPMTRDDAPYHNTSGPMSVEIPPFKTLMAEAFLQAGRETGQPMVDYNGKYQTGFMYPPVTTRDGARCSTYRAYLKPAMETRSNLQVETHALVTKILFDDSNTATGVVYEKDGVECTIKANREVIISAGAYNSPQLLMLSGIGPKEHLESHKINVVHDLPGVGQNLQDHLTVGGLLFTFEQEITLNSVRYETEEYIDLWERDKTGPMTVPVSFEGVAFYKTNVTEGPDDWPDLELFFNSDNTARVFKPMLMPEAASTIPDDAIDAVSFHPILLRPKSRGTVTLQSADPHEAPLIDPKYLSHKDDVEVMAESITIIQNLGATKAFQQYHAKLLNNGVFSGCLSAMSEGLQEYKRCYARALSSTGYHPSSTCKMAPESDPAGVVDQRLRVHGVKNLRVADASIMPNVVAGHPQAACMAIGEKVADLIKEDMKISKI